MTFRAGFRRCLFAALAVPACAAGQIDLSPGDAATDDVKITPPLPTDGQSPAPVTPDAAAATDAGDDGPSVDATPDARPDASDAGVVVVTPPVIDGTVAAAEYGTHANGQNQQQSTPGDPAKTTWYVVWTDTHLYVALTAATVTEGVILYLENAPRVPATSGTSADGSLAGNPYDNTNASSLPFRADFVAYVKSGYNEYRTADGAGGWSAPTAAALNVQAVGATREIAIPWALIRPGGRPASFSWLGYATSAAGFVYAPMPIGNAEGAIGLSSAFGYFFKVSDATPGSGTKPFAVKASP